MNGKAESKQGSADAVLAAVGEAVGGALAGGHAGSCAAGSCLSTVLLDARRAGRPVVQSLRALQKILRLAADLERVRTRLLALYRGRLGLAALVALGARASLAAAAPEAPAAALDPAMDGLAVALAVLLSVATYLAFARSLPHSWLVRGTLTPAAITWLRAHALHQPPRELPCHSAWHALRARELACGLDLSFERRHLLESWAEDRSLEDALALRRAEDRLPLAELLGLGLPLLLALLAPALGALASSR